MDNVYIKILIRIAIVMGTGFLIGFFIIGPKVVGKKVEITIEKKQ